MTRASSASSRFVILSVNIAPLGMPCRAHDKRSEDAVRLAKLTVLPLVKMTVLSSLPRVNVGG